MRGTSFFVIDGVKYAVKAPEKRPNLKQLTKNGIITRIDFDDNFEWLEDVTEKWAGHPKVIEPTYEKINGIWVKMHTGDILIKATKLNPTSKQTYLLECYDMQESNECDMLVLANVAGPQAQYIIPFTKGGLTPLSRKKIFAAAQVMSAMMLGSKVYINIINYRVYDNVTGTENPRIVDILPIHYMGKDFLLDG